MDFKPSKAAPFNAVGVRDSLVRHIERYGTVVHKTGSSKLSAEEIKVQQGQKVPNFLTEPKPITIFHMISYYHRIES